MTCTTLHDIVRHCTTLHDISRLLLQTQMFGQKLVNCCRQVNVNHWERQSFLTFHFSCLMPFAWNWPKIIIKRTLCTSFHVLIPCLRHKCFICYIHHAHRQGNLNQWEPPEFPIFLFRIFEWIQCRNKYIDANSTLQRFNNKILLVLQHWDYYYKHWLLQLQ